MKYFILGVAVVFAGILTVTRNHLQALGALIVMAGAALILENKKRIQNHNK